MKTLQNHMANGMTRRLRMAALFVFGVFSAALAHGDGTNDPLPAGRNAAAQAYFREGLELVRKAEYTAAIKLFRAALKQNPRMAEACLNLGACFERLGQFDTGAQYYDQALMIEPKNPQFHYLYGTALARNGQTAKGVALLERAAYLVPGDVDYLYNLGVGYTVLTQYTMAAACFEQVTGLVSNNSVVWYNLGLARLRLNQTDEAVRAWSKVEIDAPVAAEAYYHLGSVAASRGDTSGAFDRVKMSLALNPGLAEGRRLLASLSLRGGDYRRAAAELEQVYLMNPTDEAGKDVADAYCAWAHDASASNDHRRAMDRYRQAVRFVPADAAVHLGIARSALEMGDEETAREALARARKHARTRAQEEEIHALGGRIGRDGTVAPDGPTNGAAEALNVVP